MDKIRILIVDDHVLLREGTRQLLEREEDLEVIGEAGDGEEAVNLSRLFQPHVILMDISMPRMDGTEAIRQIKSEFPQTSILVLTGFDDEPNAIAALKAGAVGYLLKNVPGREMIQAIRAVYRGEGVLSPSIVSKVVGHLAALEAQPAQLAEATAPALSKREMEVLRLMAQAKSNPDIAEELVVSIRTVQTHIGSIFSKLGVSSRTEAVIFALKQGWVDLSEAP